MLAPLGAVRARRMFGGHGLYVDALFIALIAEERLYLKADAQSRATFERADCTPFTYSRSDTPAVTLSYWSAPDEALDSAQGMAPWARLALAAALRAKADKRTPAAAASRATQRKAAPRKTATARKSAARR
jgi:DNA transformation protein and related proteins